jgi:hypothetical protein
MEQFFKNRKEVEQFFKDEVFAFKFMSDNIIYFETLNPIFLGNELYNFSLCFYYEDCKDFFRYSSFNQWLDQFQLSEVVKINEATQQRESLYFAKYNETA